MIDATVAPKVGCRSPFGTTVCHVNHINARPEPRLEAGATEERRLEGVGSRPMCGVTSGIDIGLTHLQHVSHPCEVHLLQHRATEKAVGIAERLDDFEVVVALADEELDRFACRLHGRRKVPRLALELGGLQGAVGDNHGGGELVKMALRTQRLLHLVGQVDVCAAR